MRYRQLQPEFQAAIDSAFNTDVINRIQKRRFNYEITWISKIRNEGSQTIVSVLNDTMKFVVKDTRDYEPGDYVILVDKVTPTLIPIFVKRKKVLINET